MPFSQKESRDGPVGRGFQEKGEETKRKNKTKKTTIVTPCVQELLTVFLHQHTFQEGLYPILE